MNAASSLTEAAADALAGGLLDARVDGLPAPLPDRWTAFQRNIVNGLVTAGHQGGPLSTLSVLNKLVGEDAVAQAILVSDPAPLISAAVGADLVFLDVPAARRRRWKEFPLRVHQVPFVSGVSAPCVVARCAGLGGEYTRFMLYDPTMDLFGATPTARDLMWRWNPRQRRTLRVWLDGRVQRVRALAEFSTVMTVGRLAERPEWHRPEARPMLVELKTTTTALLRPVTMAFLRAIGVPVHTGVPNPPTTVG
jgi:hypothetical protein